MQLRMTISTVVNLYFGQIWTFAVKLRLWGEFGRVEHKLDLFLTETIGKKSSNRADYTTNR